MKFERKFGMGACCVAACACGAMGDFELASGLEQGRSETFEVSTEMVVEQRNAPEADPSSYTSNVDAVLSFEVQSVSKDGMARVSCEVEEFRARYEDPDGPTSVFFDMVEDENAQGLAALEAMLMKSPITFTVDSKGNVTEMTGLDEFYSASSTAPGFSPELFAFFRTGSMVHMFEKMWNAEGGLGTRAMNDTWTTTRRESLGSGGALEINTANSVQIAQEDLVAIVGVIGFDLYVPRERGDDTPEVSIGQGSAGQVLTRWDLENGGLVSRSESFELNTDWTRGDLRVMQYQMSRTTISRQN